MGRVLSAKRRAVDFTPAWTSSTLSCRLRGKVRGVSAVGGEARREADLVGVDRVVGDGPCHATSVERKCDGPIAGAEHSR